MLLSDNFVEQKSIYSATGLFQQHVSLLHVSLFFSAP